MNQKLSYIICFMLWMAVFASSCKVDEPKDGGLNNNPGDSIKFRGTSELVYTDYQPLKDKPVKIYFHVPNSANPLTPILFVFHGTDRNAKFCRDVLIAKANELNFIVVAPEFGEQYYPGADKYNLGNLFVDGDNPTASTLNNESIWTFSLIEPMFQYMKTTIGSAASTFDIFGHSAGGQFAHRYLLFKPNAKLNKLVSAASGWYTLFDNTIDFPYGTKKSPMEFAAYNNLFNKKVFVVIGDADIDPNSDGLRHNEIVDQQGLNRFERAQYFYAKSREEAGRRASPFNWKYNALKGVGHDFTLTSAAGVLLLYK